MANQKDDKPTVAAIAVIAACAVTLAHEAIGHGLTCLASGGSITQLTSAYFQCSAHSTAMAAAGPAGNLVAAALAWWTFSRIPEQGARTPLLLLLTMAFSIFWFAGYLMYSAAMKTGDFYFVARDLIGEPPLALRVAALIAADVINFVGISETLSLSVQLCKDPKRVRVMLFVAWLAASASATAAALAYAPDRLGAAGQAALQIGAASLPILSRAVVAPVGPQQLSAVIPQNWPWIGASLIIFALFIATLGRGMP